MGKKLTKIADLTPAPYNPRSITDEALGGLKASLERFGDISGLVWNSRSGHLVAGHQRLRALSETHNGALEMKAGQVVAPTGESFPVRVVDWDDATEKAANISANNQHISGAFTANLGDLLAELDGDFDGFEELRLGDLLPQLPDDFGIPGENKAIDEEAMSDTDNECPKCGFKW